VQSQDPKGALEIEFLVGWTLNESEGDPPPGIEVVETGEFESLVAILYDNEESRTMLAVADGRPSMRRQAP